MTELGTLEWWISGLKLIYLKSPIEKWNGYDIMCHMLIFVKSKNNYFWKNVEVLLELFFKSSLTPLMSRPWKVELGTCITLPYHNIIGGGVGNYKYFNWYVQFLLIKLSEYEKPNCKYWVIVYSHWVFLTHIRPADIWNETW